MARKKGARRADSRVLDQAAAPAVAAADPHVYQGPGESDAPATLIRADLNDHALRHILPGAAQACEEGQLREIAAERDIPQFQQTIFFASEVRGLMYRNAAGLMVEKRGLYKTVDPLPYGIPPLMGASVADLHMAYRHALMKKRIARNEEQARKLSHGNAIRFVLASGGVDFASGDAVL